MPEVLAIALHLRVSGKVDTNPWNASTLEWLPFDDYGARSIPRVESREPLWDRPALREEVASGRHYLPGTATGGREALVTSPVDARPQYILLLPRDGWTPFLAAAGTAAFFLLLTVKLMTPAVIAGAVALGLILRWLWRTDRRAVIWGIVVGTYSTICVAAPLLIYMHLHRIRGKETPDSGKKKTDKPAQQGA